MVGIVDCGCLAVTQEIKDLLFQGRLSELAEGGFIADNDVLLIPGSEIESREGVHIIIYFSSLKSIEAFQKQIKNRLRNLMLSTQKTSLGVSDLVLLSEDLGGIICPAHVFTPHKGIYGQWTDRLYDKLGEVLEYIKVLELGLSADTDMADLIKETSRFSFLSNSDAHSLENVAREYNLLAMARKNFQEFKMCIERKEGRCIKANYGLDPLLGKYYRSYCSVCGTILNDTPPVFKCGRCGCDKLVTGVYDRIMAISDYKKPVHPEGRPPYHYRVQLRQIPGIGPKTLNKLLNRFENEINILEKIDPGQIAEVAGNKIADMIDHMRSGRLAVKPGGGGYYGKVQKYNCNY
jgi:uncharacterized protein (TIGR00375 family)